MLFGTVLAGGVSADRPWLLVGGALVYLAVHREDALGCLARGTLGLLVGWLLAVPFDRPDGLIVLDPDRPVEIIGTVRGHTERVPDALGGEDRERLEVVTERVRQGDETVRSTERVFVSLPLAADSAAPVIGWGRRIQIRGYLRRAPGWRNPGSDARTGPWRITVESRRFVEVGRGSPWGDAATGWRHLLDRAASELDGDGGALVRALVLGDRSQLPERWTRALRATGLAHVMAVSGLHVGLFGGLVWWLTGGCRRPVRLTLVAIVLALQVVAVGPRPAVLRAAIMGWMAIGALAMRRPPLALHTLTVAACGLLLFEPSWIHDRGFLLSISATAGLILGAPRLVQRWSGWPRWLAVGLSATVAAQLATWPWLLPWAPWWSPASLWLNLLAVPWLVLTLVVSWLAVACGIVARIADGVGDLGVELTVPSRLVLDLLAERSPSTWILDVDGLSATLVAAAVTLVLWRPRWLVSWLLVGGLMVAGWRVHDRPKDPEVIALDVGQGDALVLRYGSAGILVDGGGWRRGDVGGRLVEALAALGVYRLDAVVLTHPDTDHCRGLLDLAAYRRVHEVWTPPGWDATCALDLLGRHDVRWRPLWRGHRLRAGPWRGEVLWPPPGGRGQSNGRSLVVRFEVSRRRLLLTGDLEAAEERRLVAIDRHRLAADGLKIAHHGSKTSTSAQFLDAVSPRWALLSAGRSNPYGHPHASVLDRLAARRVTVWRTDRHGAIRIRWSTLGPPRVRVEAGDAADW
ncbi:MAG: DNA internalization-related competence protein ComEC/Rec2 [Acidobacteriota bacterium]